MELCLNTIKHRPEGTISKVVRMSDFQFELTNTCGDIALDRILIVSIDRLSFEYIVDKSFFVNTSLQPNFFFNEIDVFSPVICTELKCSKHFFPTRHNFTICNLQNCKIAKIYIYFFYRL